MSTTLYVSGRGLLWPILREERPETNQAAGMGVCLHALQYEQCI